MANGLGPLPRQGLSIWQNIRFYVRATIFSRLVTFFFWNYKRKTKALWAARAPTQVLSYHTRPELQVRVFQASRKTTSGAIDTPAKAPVFFLIHGGGWIFGSADTDDEQAHLLSTKHGFCVMSLEYRMAPKHRFPTAIYDLEFLIEMILNDGKLIEKFNMDTSKVVLGGFSAGGVMTLSLAQLPSIQDRVHALVPFYPLTDFTNQNRGPEKISAWGKVDELPARQPLFDWAYVPVGQDLRDPLLSPLFATRSQIPQPTFMITAEKDSVCKEGWLLARKLAGLEANDNMDIVEPWEENGVRYECAVGMMHSFTHFWEYIRNSEEWERKRRQTNELIWSEVAKWTKSVL